MKKEIFLRLTEDEMNYVETTILYIQQQTKTLNWMVLTGVSTGTLVMYLLYVQFNLMGQWFMFVWGVMIIGSFAILRYIKKSECDTILDFIESYRARGDEVYGNEQGENENGSRSHQ